VEMEQLNEVIWMAIHFEQKPMCIASDSCWLKAIESSSSREFFST